jgi:predicted PurR-regulated permease PerM
MNPAGKERCEISITITWGAILKILAAALLTYAAFRLWELFEVLFVALLIAITLRPVLDWTRRQRWPDWVGITFCTVLLMGIAASAIGILIPTVTNETGKLLERLPEFRNDVISHLPADSALRTSAEQLLSGPSFNDPQPIINHLVQWGAVALKGLAGFLVVLVVSIYFLVDGERVYHWLLAFLPPVHREKAAIASPQIAEVVGHYMVGQLITSVLCGLYAFAVLFFLKVPNAALLAVLAAIFDLLPLIGFFLFTIPAVGVALTVAPWVALVVALLYGAYHLVENYFIVPKVYGNRLRLSTLTVLVSCLGAGLIAGVVGVIAILPIVASYPIIEKIWLRPYLERDTVTRHREIDAQAAEGKI